MNRPAPDMLLDMFSRYNRALRIFIRNVVRCEQTADEIAQETYVRLAAMDSSNASIDNPKAYLFRTARNIALDFLRRKNLRIVDEGVEVDGDAIVSAMPTPEDNLVHAQTKKLFEKAMKELPSKTRRVFYYRRYEGLAIKHVAARMNMSERAVYNHMEDAMQHLALRLKGKG